jgi:hypothetical protein
MTLLYYCIIRYFENENKKENRNVRVKFPSSSILTRTGASFRNNLNNDSDSFLSEATGNYPESFSMETLQNISTVKDRVNYAKTHLKKIGSGSSRIVYASMDEKIALKVAKNSKGTAQNKNEYDISTHYGNGNPLLACVFDADKENFKWIEMEFAKKLNNEKQFEKLSGMSFENFNRMVLNIPDGWNSVPPKIYKEVNPNGDSDEFIDNFMNICSDWDMCIRDFNRLKQFGVVNRNGKFSLVIIDYGLTQTTFDNHYKR